MSAGERIPFVIIGENVHASRTHARNGRNVTVVDGVEMLAFRDIAGVERTCPIAARIARSGEYARNRVKHIRNGLLLGLGGDGELPMARTDKVTPEAAQAARDYLIAIAVRQQWAGATYIDVNVDEIAEDLGIRRLAMEWLVCLLERELDVPLSLDSSSPQVLEAGLRASSLPCGPVLLNSAASDRPEVLDLAADRRVAVVLSAAGEGPLASTIAGRIERAEAVYRCAQERGIRPAECHVDLLVLPAGVDGGAGRTFLGAARAFREAHGPEVRITGGLSNASFGLPSRRLLNDTFVALSIDAGVDSGILDPIALSLDRIRSLDRRSRQFQAAAGVLLGADAFALEYLAAYRAGELVGA